MPLVDVVAGLMRTIVSGCDPGWSTSLTIRRLPFWSWPEVDRVVDEVSMANERLLAGTEVDLPHPSGVGAGVVARFIRYVDRVVRPGTMPWGR